MRGVEPEGPMAKFRNPLAGVRLVCKKTSTLTKIVVSTAVVLSIAALLMLHGAIRDTRADTEDLRQQAIALEQEHALLEQYEKEKGTIKEVIRIAMERLGLVQPDSIVIQPE